MPVKADNDNLIVARYYDNLADSKIIFSIKKENKGKAGIYRITNKIKGKSYIGSSYRLHLRFYAYFSASGLKRTERVIVQAIFKYGLINFSLEVLEYIEQKDLSIPFLLEREQYYLDLLKPEYNILKIAGSSKGFKYSEEDKIKLSQMRAKGKDHL
jgi:group I intron endonuclease